MQYKAYVDVVRQVRLVEQKFTNQLSDGRTHLDFRNQELTGWPAFEPWFATIDLSYNQFRSLPVFLPAPKDYFRPSLLRLWAAHNRLRRIEEGDLPKTLVQLDLSHNPLTEICGLPPPLRHLILTNTELKSLCALPEALRTLSCSLAHLESLPPLPPTLVKLHLTDNKLTVLPQMPATLQELCVGHNLLTTLPPLPEGLLSLEAHHNQLVSVGPLPSTLTYIRLHNNRLKGLGPLPPGLTALYLCDNELTEIPASIVDCVHLEKLECRNNKLETLPPLPPMLHEAAYNGWNLRVEGNKIGFVPVYDRLLGDFVKFVEGHYNEHVARKRTHGKVDVFKDQMQKIANFKSAGRYL